LYKKLETKEAAKNVYLYACMHAFLDVVYACVYVSIRVACICMSICSIAEMRERKSRNIDIYLLC